MKTSLLLIAAGSLLLASCKPGDPPKTVSQAGPFTIHPIAVSLTETNPDGDSHHVKWKLHGASNHGRTELIHSNEVVQWHFSSSFFLYIDQSKSAFTNWDDCRDEAGNRLPWTNCTSCPFNQTNHRALCATQNGDWVVSVVFPPYATHHGDYIRYRLVTGFDCLQAQQKILLPTYDYNTLEATLVWDSSGLLEDQKTAPSK